MKLPLIIITGPTAAGKTSLSVKLARQIGAEIISADSMQVYRHMDVGSAKITKAEMEEIPHHLIDILEPREEFNVVCFQKLAKKAAKEIWSRGKIPIVAGGTGFYIQALLYDVDFTETGEDDSFRNEMEAYAKEQGAEVLHARLAAVDLAAAEVIHPNNVKRVIRALEFYQQTGGKISEHNERERQRTSPYEFLYYVINREREELYQRIDRRVDQMLLNGLIEEVKFLKEIGCTKNMVSMQGLGYKEILSFLDGECSLEEVASVIKRDTRHFAKRQITWFKREKDVRWLNMSEDPSREDELLSQILKDVKETFHHSDR